MDEWYRQQYVWEKWLDTMRKIKVVPIGPKQV